MTKKEFWKKWSNDYDNKYKCEICNTKSYNLILIKKRIWENVYNGNDDYNSFMINKTCKVCEKCFIGEEND